MLIAAAVLSVIGSVGVGMLCLTFHPPSVVERNCINQTVAELGGCMQRERWIAWFAPCCALATLGQCTVARYFPFGQLQAER